MILTRDKINCITKVIMETLDRDELVDFLEDDIQVRQKIVSVINDEVNFDGEIDKKIRKILQSFSRTIHEDSNDWDVMYKKFYEEEITKRVGK